jgi:integrase
MLGLELEKLALSPKQEQLLRRVDLEAWLLRQSNPVAQRLTERIATPWTDQDVRELERDALIAFSAASAPIGPLPSTEPGKVEDPKIAFGSGECAEYVVQILRKIIAAKNEEQGTSLPNVGLVSTLRYPVNPFRRDVVAALARVRLWRQRLPTAIRVSQNQSPGRGLVLLSAALYGGIFDLDLLVAVARALSAAPGTLGLANQRLYLQISVAWRGVQDFTRRTWYPDPLTAALIVRLASGQLPGSEEGEDLRASNRLWREILDALRSADVDKADEPETLSEFLADLRVTSQLQMPSLLAAYAAHGIRAQGLPAKTLERIYSVRPGEPIAVDVPDSAKMRKQPEGKRVLASLEGNQPEVEPDWQRRLRKLLGQKTPGDARRLLGELLKAPQSPEYSATTRLILEFTEYMLSPERGKKRLTMRTVRPRVLTVIRHIGSLLEEAEEDFIVLSQVLPETFEDIYREALEEIDPEDETPSVRKRLVDSLRAFHAFLVRKHRVKPLEDTSIFSVGRSGSPVDANLITIEEYHKILDWLQRKWPSTVDPQLRPLARMMVILGFRCGLRQSEVLGISQSAVSEDYGAKPELLIQPSFANRLKSPNAKRRLPLFLLMSKQECQQFLEFARRADVRSNRHRRVFDVSAPRLLRIIHDAMRSVTGDRSLRFHHLRHSFATWTLMRLMVGEAGNIPECLAHLPTTQAWLEESRTFCTQMYDVLPSTTRRHAYLVAQMMGHSHPTVTLQYYVHGMDWILDSCLRGIPDFQPNIRTVALASGLPERTAYNLAQQSSAAIPVRMLTRKWTEMATVTPVVAEEAPSWPWRARAILYRHLCLKDGLHTVADDCGFTPDQATGILQRATYLSHMPARVRHKRRSGGWQHGMISSKNIRIACPIEPHLETDITVVTTLAPMLGRLLEGQPELLPVLRHYVDNIWKQRNQLFFRDPDQPGEAIAYLRLLEQMGIKRHFFVFHKLHHCEQLERWKVALGLPKNVLIRRLRPPNASSRSYGSWIGIEPSLSTSVPARGNNGTGSYGFRFLMLMGHIVYGKTDVEKQVSYGQTDEQICCDLIQDLDGERNSPVNGRIRQAHGGRTREKENYARDASEGYGQKFKWVTAKQILPIIRDLMRPGGPLYEKGYATRKRLLFAYLQAVSETFPDAWADHKCAKYSREKASSLLIMLALLPDVMKQCNLRSSSAYTKKRFKQLLEPVAGLVHFGDWKNSTVAISTERKRSSLLRELQWALRPKSSSWPKQA